jgi:hypothetical protein
MRKSEWSDNELEKLLSEMPKIKDHRDPRDIYQSLSIKAKIRKRPVWIVPSVASAAAVLLLFLLAPNIWQSVTEDSNSFKSNSAADSNQKIEITRQKDEGINTTDVNPENKAGFSAETKLMTISSETAIYAEDVVDLEVITYQIPDQNAQILVPVSVAVPKDNKTWFDHFQANDDKLTEEQWGLSDYYPLNATLTLASDHTTMNVDVPEDHLYGTGSTNETSFRSILEQTMNHQNQIQKITLSTNGKPGILLGNYGDITELNRGNSEGMRSYFLFQPNDSNLPFLVPSITLYKDIEKAFDSMKLDIENYGLKSPLSFNFDIDTSSKPKLVITIEGDIELINEPKNIYAIEAILLTAKEFGFDTVKFENITATQIGRFNLQNELKVPVAPNKVVLP